MNYWNYFYIFLQSNLIEIFIYYFFYRKHMSFVKNIGLVTFSNSITHPIVFFGFMGSRMTYLESVLAAEAFAVIVESVLHFYFGRLQYRQTLKASFVSNLVSWQLAPLFTYFIFFK